MDAWQCARLAANPTYSARAERDAAVGRQVYRIRDLDSGREFVIEQGGDTQGSGRVKDLQTQQEFSVDEFHRAAAGPPLMREVERREEQQRVLEALEAGGW